MTILCRLFVIILIPALLPALSDAEENIVSIDDAYRLALQSHENILSADIETAKSTLTYKETLSTLYPQLSVSGDYSRPKEPILLDNSPIIPEEKWTGTVTVTQKLYDARVPHAHNIGKHVIESTKQRHAWTIKDVLFAVARAYYSVLKNEEFIDIAGDYLILTNEELSVAREKFQAGEVPETDVLRAEVEVSKAERQLTEAQNIFLSSKAVLSNLTGMDTERDYSLRKPPEVNISIENPEQLVDSAVRNRDDLKESLTDIEIAKDNEKLASAEFHPELNLEWSDSWLDPETFSQRSDLWTMTVSVSMPIFEGGLKHLGLNEKKLEVKQSHLKYERLRKEIETEVRNSYLEAETLKSIITALSKEAELVKQTYGITKERYSAGLSNSIDLMDALNRFNSVRVELSARSYEYQLVLLNIQRVTGVFAGEYADSFKKR